MANEGGQWVTVMGRKIFIAEGESLDAAMKKQGSGASKSNSVKKVSDYRGKGFEHYEAEAPEGMSSPWFKNEEDAKAYAKGTVVKDGGVIVKDGDDLIAYTYDGEESRTYSSEDSAKKYLKEYYKKRES